ncbi:hypothetical protein AB6E53_02375 [Vibrio breoganii]|uniref:hypothetical protein n=1 Tax=Vibrio breoganii TaxID=553239 RepID=UPI001055B979|nr:hypothetical protein [Vibrio breoganii]
MIEIDKKVRITFFVSMVVMVCGWVYDYAELRTKFFVKEQTDEKRFVSIEARQLVNTEVVNTVDTIKNDVAMNRQFIDRFDKFLEIQQDMNAQLIELSTQQKYILKKLEHE